MPAARSKSSVSGIFTTRCARERDLLARRAVAAIAEHAVARRKPVTPAPTLSTTPANSEAGENGNGGLNWYLPAMISVSKKLSAAALIATTTSP